MANEFKIRKGLIVTGASGGTVVDIQGSQGQLFSVTDDLSGSIFAVSDISGVPILDVNSSGTVTIDGLLTGDDATFSKRLTLNSPDYGQHLAMRRGIYGYDTIITGTRVDFSPTADTLSFKFLANLQSTGNVNGVAGTFTGNLAVGNASSAEIYLNRNSANYINASDAAGFLVFRTGGTTTALTLNATGAGTFGTQAFATTATSSGDASSTLTTKGYVDGLITGATIYRGAWDPSGGGYGSPDLSGVTQTSGYYYICSADGTAEPNGTGTEPDTWAVGDWVIYNDVSGTGQWQKIDNSSVLSGVGTGQTVALWEGAGSVTDSETLGNAPITVSGNNATFAGTIYASGSNSVDWSTAYQEARQWDGGNTNLTASTGRVSLGATTIGDNMFTLANPGAITFPRFNADNTISPLAAAPFRNAIGAAAYTALANYLPLSAGSSYPLTGDLYGTNADFSGTVTAADLLTVNGDGHLFLGATGETPKIDMLYTTNASGRGWDTRIFTGRTDDLPNGQGFPTSTIVGGFGTQYQANSDGAFFGIIPYATGHYRPIINWGDDTTDTPFSFQFNGTNIVNIDVGGNVGANSFTGDHRGTINTATTGTTQTAGNNSTKIATTAYADAAAGAVPIGNYVTLATAQTISGAKTFNNDVTLNNTYLLGVDKLEANKIVIGTDTSTILGDVGIGTTSPDAKLHVANEASFTSGQSSVEVVKLQRINTGGDIKATTEGHVSMYATDSNNDTEWARMSWVNDNSQDGGLETEGALSFWTSQAGTLNRAMYIDHDQNVGIGTTSPNKLLDVSSDDTPTIRITNTLQSSSNYTAGVFEFYSEDASTPGGARVLSSILCVNNAGSAVPNGNLAFYTALGGGSGAAATEKMRILANGNVGIGTTIPTQAKLVVNGNVAFNQGDETMGQINPLFERLDFKVSDGVVSATPVAMTLRDYANGPRLGIGTTTPSAKLDIQGTQGQLFSVTDNLSGSIFAVADISGVPIFDVNSSGVSYFDGNVGIGTASPSSKLDISVTPSAPWMKLINANETAFNLTTYNNGTNNGSSVYAFKHGLYYSGTENAAVTFYRGGSSVGGFLTFTTNNGTERMRIDSSGNVGIGVTTTSYKLEVSGASKISGNVIIGSDPNTYANLTLKDATTTGSSSKSLHIISQNSGRSFLSLITAGTGEAQIGFGTSQYASQNTAGSIQYTTATNKFTFKTNYTLALTIANNQAATFTSTVTATNFILSSDKTLKNNIKEIDTSHIDVNWKNFELKSEPGVKRSGVIAQELEEKHPEFVRTDDEGMKSVAYIDLLIAKIAELEARLEKAGI